MSRLIIISNRLPFSLQREGERVVVRQSSGGLVSALKSYFEGSPSDDFSERIWVGSMDAVPEDWQAAQESEGWCTDFSLQPVFPEKGDYEEYYNGFSNSTLWPLFHYFPSLVEYKRESFAAYERVNRMFAEAVTSIYREGDVIWVHDYQLVLLPQMLRERLPRSTIGFFLHIPFPSYEIFRLLPQHWKRSLMRGMLGADLVGFHTYDYVQHFIQTAKMVLQVESHYNNIQFGNRWIKADLFPIGIDYNKFREACTDETVVGIATGLEEKFIGQKIIFSVDRLDYTKGLNYRLDGFEQFLTEYPEWREKVVFILNVVPSRDIIPTYSDRKRMIEEKVSTINGKFSTLHWQPLIYRYNHLQFEELCALYQVADVALITPLRDGMNLVAKEYVASCIDKGVLVLSELTGAASELNEAIIVNPTDTDEVSESLHRSLVMPLTEQRSRLSYMQRRIAEYDVFRWINDFLDQLMETKKEQEKLGINILSPESEADMAMQFSAAQKRCILLDYDGTLAPYQKLPALAAPEKELLNLLQDLSRDPQTEVIIISGRDSGTLERWLGHLPLTLVGEHGALVRPKGENWKELVSLTSEWKDQVRPLMQLFVDRCAGSFIEEKISTLAWHYRNTHAELGFTRSRELRNSLLQLTANTPLQVIDGNKVLEVRRIGVDKGTTALSMLSSMEPDFVLCMGDDTTDEDMFRALRDRAWTIRIGRGNTEAAHNLLSQNEVFPLLRRLQQALQRKTEKAAG